MKVLAAFVLALALFAGPTMALAAVGNPSLDGIFDRYQETIVHGE
ncbi:MAG: hypothetical protein ACE5MG_12845 [Candidatus Methylomirabilales bacterium]